MKPSREGLAADRPGATWRIHVRARQRPGSRPERINHAVNVEAATQTAAAELAVIDLVRRDGEAGRPTEIGTRFETDITNEARRLYCSATVIYEPVTRRPPRIPRAQDMRRGARRSRR